MTKLFSLMGLMLLFLTSKTQANQQELINVLQNKYQEVTYYKASFTQEKNVSYISKPLITEGKLEFALDEGLIWQVVKPVWVKTLITNRGVFKTSKYHTKQRVKDLQIKLIAEIMTELLTANLDKIESHFSIVPITNNEDNNVMWRINLVPKKLMLKKTLKQITLMGQKIKTNEDEKFNIKGITEIIISDKSDNTTRIILDNIQLHKGPLSDEIRNEFK